MPGSKLTCPGNGGIAILCFLKKKMFAATDRTRLPPRHHPEHAIYARRRGEEQEQMLREAVKGEIKVCQQAGFETKSEVYQARRVAAGQLRALQASHKCATAHGDCPPPPLTPTGVAGGGPAQSRAGAAPRASARPA